MGTPLLRSGAVALLLLSGGAGWAQEAPEVSVGTIAVEQSSATKAMDLHVKGLAALDAARQKDPELGSTDETIQLFSEAAKLYGEYLEVSDKAEDYYQIQWYRAATLRLSQQYAEADAAYTQLTRNAKRFFGKDRHPYAEGARWRRFVLRRRVLLDSYGTLGERNSEAAVASQVTLKDGTVRSVYAIGDDYQRFIDDADSLAEATFEDALPDEKYGPLLDASRPAMVYEPGQIYFEHGHYDEARKRLFKVIERWPLTENAQFAARYIMVSYQEEGDLANVRLWGGKFARMQLGEDPTANAEFADLEEGAAFQMAAALRKSGDNENAAQAYLDFMRDFPDSQYIQAAHKNAAYVHTDLGHQDKANELFRGYIARLEKGEYKQEASDWAIYDMIAEGYALTLELDQAVASYEQLYERSQASDEPYDLEHAALYNAGSLKIGLGDHRGAAETLEKYAQVIKPKDGAEAEQTMFRTGLLWERVGPLQGLDFYLRYLTAFGDTHPDHAMEAHYRIARLMETLEASDLPYKEDPIFAAVTTYLQKVVSPDDGVEAAPDAEDAPEAKKAKGAKKTRKAKDTKGAPDDAGAPDAAPKEDVDGVRLSWAALVQVYQRVQPGDGVSVAGRGYAAKAALRELQESYDAFVRYEYPDNWPAMGTLIVAKKAEYGLFVKQCEDLIVEYKEFESTSAAFYLLGMSGYAMGDFVYNIPHTADLPDTTYAFFQEESFSLIDTAEGKGRAKLELLLEKAKTKGWNEWTAKALEFLSQKDPVAFAPDRPEVRGQLVSASLPTPKGTLDAAIAEVKTLLQQDARNLEAYNSLALVYLQHDKADLAAFILDRALSTIDGAEANATVHSILGAIQLQQGFPHGARSKLEKALAIDKGHVPAMLFLAQMMMDERDWEAAATVLENARDREPRNAYIYNNLGIVYRGLERFEESEAAYRKAIKLDSASPHPYLNLALLKGFHLGAYEAGMAEVDTYRSRGGTNQVRADAIHAGLKTASADRDKALSKKAARETAERALQESERKAAEHEDLLEQQRIDAEGQDKGSEGTDKKEEGEQ